MTDLLYSRTEERKEQQTKEGMIVLTGVVEGEGREEEAENYVASVAIASL